MFQTDQPTASNTLPTPAPAGTQGYFTNGNPATGVAATIVDADYLNMMMMELVNVVLAAGETPSKTTYNQVALAVKRLVQAQVALTDSGAVNAYAAANTPPLTVFPTTGFIQRVNVAHANTGASTYAPDGLTAKPIYGLGLQPLQGGELIVNGVATMMYLVAATVNSGNGAWILLECTGGALQIAPATQSGHAVQLGQVSGVVGSARNLVMNVAAVSATASLTADEIIVETALGGLRYCLANFNKTINLATTGAGGMDTGTSPASAWIAIYAIYNPTTNTAALLGAIASSSMAPSIYAGGYMPAGYSASALVSVINTNASGQFNQVLQYDRTIWIQSITALSTGSPAVSPTVLGLQNAVPPNAKTVIGNAVASTTTASPVGITIGANAAMIGPQHIAGSIVISALGDYEVAVVGQSIYYFASSATSASIFVTGYRI